MVTLIRKTINFDLNLDSYFHQTDSVPSELISLIDLTTENNSSSRNGSQSTLKIARLIVYSYKKGTQKRQKTVEKVSINHLIEKIQL